MMLPKSKPTRWLLQFFMASCLWVCASCSAYCSVDWYDQDFKQASELWLPGWDWRWLKAQCQQESQLRSDAVSPAGAIGLCQFMPATWREESARLGKHGASPYDPHISIQAAASYMGRLRRMWAAERPESDRREIAQACYNAGAGNILQAQRRCGNARHWPEISMCLPGVTGPRNADETITYVQRIHRWYLFFLAD